MVKEWFDSIHRYKGYGNPILKTKHRTRIMKTENEIREYRDDCKKALKENEDGLRSNDYLYQGIVEGLEFVLTDNSLVTKEEQSKLNSIGDNINPVPRNLNGRFTIVRAFRIEVVFVEEINERIEFIIFQVLSKTI